MLTELFLLTVTTIRSSTRSSGSPIVELVRTLSKTDLRDLVDDFTNQTGHPEVGRATPFEGLIWIRLRLLWTLRGSHSAMGWHNGSPSSKLADVER